MLNNRLGQSRNYNFYSDARATPDLNSHHSQIDTEKGNSESYYYDEEADDNEIVDGDQDGPEEQDGEECSYQSQEGEEDDCAEEVVDNRRFNRR